MKVASGVTNMALAHEIAVDQNFKLKKVELPENSVEKHFQVIMHQAFWDMLMAQLRDDPPRYDQAMSLLKEVKEGLISLLLPQHTRLRSQVNEVLDLDLIRQKAEHDAIDINIYAQFILSVMAKLCAPVWDDKIKELTEIKEIVPLYRGILEMIEHMKLDMANFTLQQLRPTIQQHSVEYERVKFQEFLDTHPGDGLEFTRKWLKLNKDKLLVVDSPPEGDLIRELNRNRVVSPTSIIARSYLDLLEWDDKKIFPETLLMDQSRFLELRDKTERIKLVASILLVTYNTVGGAISGITGFKEKLKDQINILLQDVNDRDISTKIVNVAEQIEKEVNACLEKHGYPMLEGDRPMVLKGQIKDVIESNHPVHKLISSRVMEFIKHVTTTTTASPIKVPPGLAAMSVELMQVSGQFLRLVSHNRSVFGQYYANIIRELLGIESPQAESTPKAESTTAAVSTCNDVKE
ncbi:PREDICTED: T-complex protein 11-like protein 1 isoform X2 [Priapulus caudatus]|nr:PREDICTED: T-complex protein 11-like protein 1 isoform X2 [Priapulus caudatus]